VKGRPIYWSLLAVAALAATAFLLPAAADWLVTKDGARLETDGPWKVKGRLIVFKRPDGTYASIRQSEVDLEASQQLTLEMAEAAKQPKPEETERRREHREPIARLTEKELPSRGPLGGGDNGATTEAPEDEGQGQPLQVVNWREVTGVEDAGVTFVGQVRNVSEHMALGVTLTVTLLGEGGDEIASTTAQMTTDTLPPQSAGGFRVTFPGVFTYNRADFDVTANMVRTEGSTPREETAEEGEG